MMHSLDRCEAQPGNDEVPVAGANCGCASDRITEQSEPAQGRKGVSSGRGILLSLHRNHTDSQNQKISYMTVFKSGDLVVLRSGGPVMTVDTVNTDIFDDNKVTGVLCAWFVGEKLERVRFDHRAIEPASSQQRPAEKCETDAEATDDYTVALGEVVAAMNLPTAEDNPAVRAVRKKSKSAPAPAPCS